MPVMNLDAEKTSSRAVNSAIKAVRTTADKYNNLVQTAIVLVIEHAQRYGDCTGAARLIDAMPRSNRRTLAINHFAEFSPIAVSKSPKSGSFVARLRKPKENAFNEFSIDGAKALNWWERPEAEKLEDVVTFDNARDAFNKALDAMAKKAEKSDDKDEILEFVKRVRLAASKITVELVKAEVQANDEPIENDPFGEPAPVDLKAVAA